MRGPEKSRGGTPGSGQFLVDIKCERNGTWQGNVTWVGAQKTASFRSALELLKLMDSAIEGDRPAWLEAEGNEEQNGGGRE